MSVERKGEAMVTITTMSEDARRPCSVCGKVLVHRGNGRPGAHASPSGGRCSGHLRSSQPIREKPAPTKPAAVPARDEHGRRLPLPGAIERWVLERDQRRCVRCGADDGLELHHIVEVSEGGQHDPDNLDTLCSLCHAGWTWDCAVGPELYQEWKRTPPGRWFERAVVLSRQPTTEGRRLADQLRTMTARDFIRLLDVERRIRLEIFDEDAQP